MARDDFAAVCVSFFNHLSPYKVTFPISLHCPAEGSHLQFALVHSFFHSFSFFWGIAVWNSFGFCIGWDTDCHGECVHPCLMGSVTNMQWVKAERHAVSASKEAFSFFPSVVGYLSYVPFSLCWGNKSPNSLLGFIMASFHRPQFPTCGGGAQLLVPVQQLFHVGKSSSRKRVVQ